MIRAIITDFDGTLVDTFEANFHAYRQSFADAGLVLSEEQYRACFGLRFERFMEAIGITDLQVQSFIRERKKEYYPQHFDCLRLNVALMELIKDFHQRGGIAAIASTARRENLMNALAYLGIADNFDLIFAGKDVKQGKPSPEIYVKAMDSLGVSPNETLIFEDSDVGIQAAKASEAYYIKIIL